MLDSSRPPPSPRTCTRQTRRWASHRRYDHHHHHRHRRPGRPVRHACSSDSVSPLQNGSISHTRGTSGQSPDTCRCAGSRGYICSTSLPYPWLSHSHVSVVDAVGQHARLAVACRCSSLSQSLPLSLPRRSALSSQSPDTSLASRPPPSHALSSPPRQPILPLSPPSALSVDARNSCP